RGVVARARRRGRLHVAAAHVAQRGRVAAGADAVPLGGVSVQVEHAGELDGVLLALALGIRGDGDRVAGARRAPGVACRRVVGIPVDVRRLAVGRAGVLVLVLLRILVIREYDGPEREGVGARAAELLAQRRAVRLRIAPV